MKRLADLIESQAGLLLMLFSALCLFAVLAVVVTIWAPKNDRAFYLFSAGVSGFTTALTTAAQVRRSAATPPTNDKRPEA